jgi:hypothetical protein
MDAFAFNEGMSLIGVAFALAFRSGSIPVGDLLKHGDVVLNPLAGSLVGARCSAARAMGRSAPWRRRDRNAFSAIALG